MFAGGPVRLLELDADTVRYSSAGDVARLPAAAHGGTCGGKLGLLSGKWPPASSSPYRDASNNTTVADNVRSIQVSLQSASDEMVRTTGQYAKLDSLTMTTRVALRNALRP
jgi:hypothetical protein